MSDNLSLRDVARDVSAAANDPRGVPLPEDQTDPIALRDEDPNAPRVDEASVPNKPAIDDALPTDVANAPCVSGARPSDSAASGPRLSDANPTDSSYVPVADGAIAFRAPETDPAGQPEAEGSSGSWVGTGHLERAPARVRPDANHSASREDGTGVCPHQRLRATRPRAWRARQLSNLPLARGTPEARASGKQGN